MLGDTGQCTLNTNFVRGESAAVLLGWNAHFELPLLAIRTVPTRCLRDAWAHASVWSYSLFTSNMSNKPSQPLLTLESRWLVPARVAVVTSEKSYLHPTDQSIRVHNGADQP